VLLDSRFAAVPAIVAEGRRVIGNVERVAQLFLTKTVYATVLAVAVVVAGLPFPFLPRQLTLVGSLTIGIPAFFLALLPNAERARSHFLPRVLRFSIPAGLIAAAASFTAYRAAKLDSTLSQAQTQTIATLVLSVVALWVLVIVARPFTPAKVLIVATVAVALPVVLALPPLRSFFALRLAGLEDLGVAAAVVAGAVALLELSWRTRGWPRRT
jgi:cation-transporting P-type ATPase E